MPSSVRKRVGIIGAGVAGLATAKTRAAELEESYPQERVRALAENGGAEPE